jgi:hypothetical protein
MQSEAPHDFLCLFTRDRIGSHDQHLAGVEHLTSSTAITASKQVCLIAIILSSDALATEYGSGSLESAGNAI